MKRGYAAVVVAALGIGGLVGWGAGASRRECEYTCPAHGGCPIPADCLNHPFNWTTALVLGSIVALVVLGVGLTLRSRAGRG